MWHKSLKIEDLKTQGELSIFMVFRFSDTETVMLTQNIELMEIEPVGETSKTCLSGFFLTPQL
jgi:hypothetical protein